MSSKSEMLSSTLILSSAKESIKTNVYSQRSLLIQPKTSLGKLPPTAASPAPRFTRSSFARAAARAASAATRRACAAPAAQSRRRKHNLRGFKTRVQSKAE